MWLAPVRIGELVFIGIGLHDERSLTLRGLEEAKASDLLFAEFYTSPLPGSSAGALEKLIGKPVRRLRREDVESGTEIISAARTHRVAFLVPGDPMAATTHLDLRLRAAAVGIPTRIVHGMSIVTAAAGTLGLQIYKFGRTTTVPFPAQGFSPTSPVEAILENRRGGLHTLVLLDVHEDGTTLAPRDAIASLLQMAAVLRTSEFGPQTLGCVVSRVGSEEVRATAGPIAEIADRDVGPGPHVLVVPGSLHFLEKEALVAFAGAPHDG